MMQVCCELVWTSRLLADLCIDIHRLIPIFCDSVAPMHIVCNPVFYERTKHIELDCHFVRIQHFLLAVFRIKVWEDYVIASFL